MTDAEIIALFEDDSISDLELEQYFSFEERVGPAGPVLGAADMNDIPNLGTAREGVLGAANRRALRRRNRRFERNRVQGWSGYTLVSAGDSWFNYPIRLKDTIDHLVDTGRYNICSLDWAGDWIRNTYKERADLFDAIDMAQPDAVLLSGGGNDMVGKMRLQWALRAFRLDRPANWYLGQPFRTIMDQLDEVFLRLCTELQERYPTIPVITHGYDYAIPSNGEWLGEPMDEIGIRDGTLQRQIARLVINELNERRIATVEGLGNVSFVDCRGLVTAWHDELHPTSDHYGRVAAAFDTALIAALE